MKMLHYKRKLFSFENQISVFYVKCVCPTTGFLTNQYLQRRYRPRYSWFAFIIFFNQYSILSTHACFAYEKVETPSHWNRNSVRCSFWLLRLRVRIIFTQASKGVQKLFEQRRYEL